MNGSNRGGSLYMSTEKSNSQRVQASMYGDKWWVGCYRHAMPYPKDNLYRRWRVAQGITQRRAAALFGIGEQAWRYRERQKRMYHLAEVLALFDASGMSHKDFFKLLNDCA
jgi:hypothetical protein